ncbi:hypothetical protein GMLC_01440 [Geomonas limicola]|uniref:Outer membrane channel protein n=1 Tax=Geomonas limicola TaxID=2740186 RepID=A0A6V8N241_9BACT|nr:TIGR03016 family PEP-CTERM system-associated outer membrane protein [Geomonas limicola]GFO66565.1 hypothetical protein GMLC_01440 [Geomonas limicola]
MNSVSSRSLERGALTGALIFAFCSAACAGELKTAPSLALSEEYNDNILETAGNRHSDMVTRVRPGISLGYQGPRATGDLSYTFDYRTYAKGTRSDEQVHTLNLVGSAALTENRLFLDLRDTLSRVSLNVTRNVTQESLFLNQTDQNLAAISPYLVWHPGEKGVLKTGYRFADTSYWGGQGIDKRSHQGYADYLVELAPRFSLNANYSYSRVHTAAIRYQQHDASGGFRYEYATNSFLYGTLGNSWQSFEGLKNTSSLFWNVGVSRTWQHLAASVESQVIYAEDPLAISTRQTSHSARLELPFTHGTLALNGSYNKYQGSLNGIADRTSLVFGGSGRWDLTDQLSAMVGLGWDRVRGEATSAYPYHMTGNAGLSYRFNYEITANLSYGYVEYRRRFESAADLRQTNRVLLEVAKVF